MAGKVTWNEAGIEELKQLAGQLCDRKAQEVIDAAIPPVDTGFLRASGYVRSFRVDTFDRTWASGVYTGREGPQTRERTEEPAEPPDEYGAVIGYAAIYAWYIEDRGAFFYPALLSVAEGE